MRVLVTGGAGYVGSHTVRALLEAGHEPVVYDNLITGHRAAVRGAELVHGDLRDKERLARAIHGRHFDGCIHFAAASLVGESVRDPSHYFHNNVGASLTLFDVLVAANISHVVVSSSAAVYGEPTSVPISEDHPQNPTNPYGESKKVVESALRWYEKAYGLSYVALRYFNAAGAHPSGEIGEDHSPETHLIPLVLQVAMKKRDSVSVLGSDYPTPDGTAVRDYVHVCDLADAHFAALNRLHSGGASGAYNLGSQKGVSVLEVIQTASRVTGQSIPLNMVGRRAGDPAVLVASAVRAGLEMDWTPQWDLSAIISSAWHWHASHPSGYQET